MPSDPLCGISIRETQAVGLFEAPGRAALSGSASQLLADNALYAPRRVYAEPERPDACKALIRRESLVPAN